MKKDYNFSFFKHFNISRTLPADQADHFIRHIKMHVDELKEDLFIQYVKMHKEEPKSDYIIQYAKPYLLKPEECHFCKDVIYFFKLISAQLTFLEFSHDIIHILRTKGFKGYENADFNFDVSLPKNWRKHVFNIFDYESFKLAIQIHDIFNMGFTDEMHIRLTCEDAELMMETLGNAIQDAEVFIAMLEEYYHDDLEKLKKELAG